MRKFFGKIFSRDDVNNGRQIEFDIAKALCIIFMILCHAFEQIPNAEGSAGAFEFIEMRIFNTFLGATLFMFCMGIGLCYSMNNTPKKIIIRGAIIFLIGFILNILRSPIAMLIVNAFTPGSYGADAFICEIFSNDILYFAGLAMILFGLLKLCKFKWWGILSVGVALSVLGTFVRGFEINNLFGNIFVGWFVGTVQPNGYLPTTSFFPLCNWFIMVAAGYSFGCLYKKVQNKKLFYLVFGILSAALVGTYIGICLPNQYLFFGEDFVRSTYHITTIDALVSMCAAIMIFGIYYAVSFILPKFLLTGCSKLSSYINTVYCIQWFFLGNATIIYNTYFPDLVYGPWVIILWAVVVATISIVLAWLYKSVLPRFIQKRKAVKAA